MAVNLPAHEVKGAFVEAMFDRIAPRYDLMNGLMTFGMDRIWRRTAVASLGLVPGAAMIDVGCGTGGLAAQAKACGARVVGVDLSESMLEVARRKGSADRLLKVDAGAMPFEDGSFDAVACGFALRNFVDPQTVFNECWRVLKPAGRFALLEIDRPPTAFMRLLHRVYFSGVVPLLGRIFSDSDAYRYLPESAAYLPNYEEMTTMLAAAGFKEIAKERLSAGAAQLMTASKGA